MRSIKTEDIIIPFPDGNIYAKKWMPEQLISDKPIILVHDSLGSVEQWKDFPAKLSENLSLCVIAYDRLGFGQSAKRIGLPSAEFIQEEATVYFPFIKTHLSIHDYFILGHSVGGGMAINIAACDSGCLAVISISAQAFIEDKTIQGIQAGKAFFAQTEAFKKLEKWHGIKADWVLRAWTDVWLSTAFAHWNLLYCLKKLLCPILIIHGDKDEYGSTAFPQFIAEHTAGDKSILILEDCAHMPHKEKPHELINAIKTFLQQGKYDV